MVLALGPKSSGQRNLVSDRNHRKGGYTRLQGFFQTNRQRFIAAPEPQMQIKMAMSLFYSADL